MRNDRQAVWVFVATLTAPARVSQPERQACQTAPDDGRTVQALGE
jgi:hypothetical protein